jgi:ankyrin repeat protein
MSSNDSFQPFIVTSPCTSDWDAMIGDERIRFCQQCQRSVHHIPELNRKEIRKLIAKSEGSLCVRYSVPEPPRQDISTPLVLHRIGKRTSVMLAGAFSASLGLSSVLASAPKLQRQTAAASATVAVTTKAGSFAASGGGTIWGTVFDPNGAVIRGAYVSVLNSETGSSTGTISDGRGEYRFGELQPGVYHLKFRAEGFDTSDVPNISLRASDESRIDQTLSIAPVQAEVEITDTTRVVFAGAGAVRLPSEPLVKAANADDLEAVSAALVGADANIRDKATQQTPLECAVHNANREMVQMLLWAKADVNLKDSSGQTVLMMLSDKATSELVWDLLNAGAKVNARDNDGDSPLIEAAQVNNLDVLKTLLDAGAKVNTSNNEGRTPLMVAAAEGLVNNVKALIQAGADINAIDKEGKNALAYAMENDYGSVIRLLKSYGAIEVEVPRKKTEDPRQ